MARPLRIEFPGAVYHVTSRGNARLPIFEDNQDRRRFLSVLDEAVKRFNWLCHAYCLMDNHYHLLVETIDGNLSVGMRRVNGVCTLTPITVGIIVLRPLDPSFLPNQRQGFTHVPASGSHFAHSASSQALARNR